MTSLPYHGLRLLAVHAHPDDESSKGAATSAKYASLGARVLIATMTGGEAGDILNPALLQSPKASRDIAGLRSEERRVGKERRPRGRPERRKRRAGGGAVARRPR